MTTTKGRILPDLSARKIDMTDVQDTTSTPSGRRKKGERVVIEFISANGAVFDSPPEDVFAVRAIAVETATEIVVGLDKLSTSVAMQGLAFGLSVLLRNAVNTTADAAEAAEAMLARGEGFLAGKYRSGVRSSVTPLIIRALALVMERAEKDADQIAATTAKWLARYRAEDAVFNADAGVKGKIADLGDKEAAAAERKVQGAVIRTLTAVRFGEHTLEACRVELATPRAKAPQGPVEGEDIL